MDDSDSSSEDYNKSTNIISDLDLFGQVKYSSEVVVEKNGHAKFINGWEVLDEIDRGSFSKVIKISHNSHIEALKIYNKIVLEGQRQIDYETMQWTNNLKRLTQDVETWCHITGHPNICSLYEIVEMDGCEKVYFRCQIGELGELASFDTKVRRYQINPKIEEIISSGKFTRATLYKKLLKQVLEGIHHMHMQGFGHRDIKLQNIVLTQQVSGDLTPLIIDFNSSKKLGDTGKFNNTEGTLNFNSPESIFGTEDGYCGIKADVWALGVCFFAMLYNELPFDVKTFDNDYSYEMSLHSAIRDNEPEYAKVEDELKSLVEIVKAMLIKDPVNRITLEDVLKSQFFN